MYKLGIGNLVDAKNNFVHIPRLLEIKLYVCVLPKALFTLPSEQIKLFLCRLQPEIFVNIFCTHSFLH